jgi:hypothetical protein
LEKGQNQYFIQFCSTNFIIEQNWWHFCSTILYLKDNLVLEITKLWVLRVPPTQIPTYNGKMIILFSEFYHRTNLTVPLLSNLGSKNKLHTQNFEICKFVQYDKSIYIKNRFIFYFSNFQWGLTQNCFPKQMEHKNHEMPKNLKKFTIWKIWEIGNRLERFCKGKFQRQKLISF